MPQEIRLAHCCRPDRGLVEHGKELLQFRNRVAEQFYQLRRDWRIGSRSFEFNPRSSPDVDEVRVTSSVCIPVRRDSAPNESPGPSLPTLSFLPSCTWRVASMTPEKTNWTALIVSPCAKSCSPALKVRLMILLFRSSFSDGVSGSRRGTWLNSSLSGKRKIGRDLRRHRPDGRRSASRRARSLVDLRNQLRPRIPRCRNRGRAKINLVSDAISFEVGSGHRRRRVI
jgi:hypothetical protein